MEVYAVKNYIKFLRDNIGEDNKCTVTCEGNSTYTFLVTDGKVDLFTSGLRLNLLSVDQTLISETELNIVDILLERYNSVDARPYEIRQLVNPTLARAYELLFEVMNGKAGIMVEIEGNKYKCCCVDGMALYNEETETEIRNHSMKVSALFEKIDKVLYVMEMPRYTTFRSYLSETAAYAESISKTFVRCKMGEF